MNRTKRARGFTLLEVLVALAIFAITAATLVNGVTGSLVAQGQLEQRSLAHWVALNQLAETRLLTVWPSVGLSDGSEEMAGHEWFWTRKVEGTSDPKLRRVDIEVRTEREDESALVRLSGFVTDRPAELAAPAGADGQGGVSGGGDGSEGNEAAPNESDEIPPGPPDPTENDGDLK